MGIDLFRSNLKQVAAGSIIHLLSDVFISDLDKATDFDSTRPYYVDDIVYLFDNTAKEHKLYRCKSNVVSPGAFNINDWYEYSSAMDILTKLKTVDGIGSGIDAEFFRGYVAFDSAEVVTTATADKVLKLNGSGLLPASVTGNAGTATKLQTARSIAISTDASGSASFDGSADVTIALTLANTGVTAGTYPKVTVDAKGRVTGGTSLVASDIPSLDWGKITTGKPTTLTGYGITDGVNVSEVVTVAAANKILKLDANSKLPASITGNADGNAATTTKLQTARNIGLTGDATGSTSFDGSANSTIAVTLADSGIAAGTYSKVTVDTKGRVTGSASLIASDIPNIDWSKITSGLPTTLAGYGILDGATKTYVDSAVQGIKRRSNVRAATTANITLSGVQTIDGIALGSGNKVLVKNQTTASQNGIYDVQAGAWVRDPDYDEAYELDGGTFVFVKEGATQSDTGWVTSSDAVVVIGTDPITFVQFSSAGVIDGDNNTTVKTGLVIALKSGIVTAGSYAKVTVDTYGRVVGNTSLVATDIPNLDWSKITTGKPTTLSGYGISDAVSSSKFQFPISYTSDLRTINQEGIFFAESTTGITNQPSDSSTGAFLQVADQGGTDVKAQYYIDNVGNDMYFQVQWGAGFWRGWKKIWSSGNFDPTTKSDVGHTHAWSTLTSKPTTLSGYGITDAIPLASLTATIPATAGWYRIAQSPVDIGHCAAEIAVDWSLSGAHGQILLLAGIMYGVNPTLKQMMYSSSNSGKGLNQVRIVYHTTNTGNYAYLEVYNAAADALTLDIKAFHALGWSLIAPVAGSIPAGYTSFAITPTDDKQLVSSAAQGTAPFVVNSSTMVANLNSQYVNGYSFNQALTTSSSPSFVTITATTIALAQDPTASNQAATKSYVDTQISSFTASGVPKLSSFQYTVMATAAGQRVFTIPMDTFDANTDTVMVFIGSVFTAPTEYTVTNTARDAGGTLTARGYITLTDVGGTDNGEELNFLILKNVITGADGSINGVVIATNSIPIDRVQNVMDKRGTTMSGQLTSSVATGTAPFVVASTTKVVNLNADMVDGYTFNQSLQTTDTPTFANLTLTQATGGAPLVVTSTTVVTNLNADMVDGLHTATSGSANTIAARDGNGYLGAQQFISYVTGAIPPFVVSNSTKVNSLNADMVDGYNLNQGVQTTDSPTFFSVSLSNSVVMNNTAALQGKETGGAVRFLAYIGSDNTARYGDNTVDVWYHAKNLHTFTNAPIKVVVPSGGSRGLILQKDFTTLGNLYVQFVDKAGTTEIAQLGFSRNDVDEFSVLNTLGSVGVKYKAGFGLSISEIASTYRGLYFVTDTTPGTSSGGAAFNGGIYLLPDTVPGTGTAYEKLTIGNRSAGPGNTYLEIYMTGYTQFSGGMRNKGNGAIFDSTNSSPNNWAMWVNGSVTDGTQIAIGSGTSDYVTVFGTRYSGGETVIVQNGYQPNYSANSWKQGSSAQQTRAIIMEGAYGVKDLRHVLLKYNMPGKAQANYETFWDRTLRFTLQTYQDESWYVDSVNGNDANDGRSSGTAKKTMAGVIANLPPIINQAITINIAGTNSTEDVSIDGFSGAGQIYMNFLGSGTWASLTITNCTCTISNGYQSGGSFGLSATTRVGIQVNGCTRVILRTMYCTAPSGQSGAVVYSGNAAFYGCSFNSRSDGISAQINANVYLEGSTIQGNTTGVSAYGAVVRMYSNTISGNTTNTYASQGGQVI